MIFKDKSKILFIGAHPDDIELNCLGSLLKFQKEYKIQVFFLICTNGGNKSKNSDRKAEQIDVAKVFSTDELLFLDYEDGFLSHNTALVSDIEKAINKINPDYVFVHSKYDHHQDHIAVSLSTISALRDKEVGLIFYPSITSTIHPLEPQQFNLLVDITEIMDRKLELLKGFTSQSNNYYMSPDFIKNSNKYMNSQGEMRYQEKFTIGYLHQ